MYRIHRQLKFNAHIFKKNPNRNNWYANEIITFYSLLVFSVRFVQALQSKWTIGMKKCPHQAAISAPLSNDSSFERPYW